MKVETYACDVCGAMKRDVNHWFILGYAAGGRCLLLFPWLEAHLPGNLTLCGAECVQKKVSEFLGAAK